MATRFMAKGTAQKKPAPGKRGAGLYVSAEDREHKNEFEYRQSKAVYLRGFISEALEARDGQDILSLYLPFDEEKKATKTYSLDESGNVVKTAYDLVKWLRPHHRLVSSVEDIRTGILTLRNSGKQGYILAGVPDHEFAVTTKQISPTTSGVPGLVDIAGVFHNYLLTRNGVN